MLLKFYIVASLLSAATQFRILTYSYATPTAEPAKGSSAQPFYGIAHRVLTEDGVRDALKHGANAIEIDIQPWNDQWYADHDGTWTSAGDTARTILNAVAAQRLAGFNIIFVWLDIKNSDYCGRSQYRCNVEALRYLARDILEPVGVRVLYGFTDASGRAYRLIRDGLNDNEAIGLEGDVDEVMKTFETSGPADIKKRVFTRGLFMPSFSFGTCEGNGTGICPEIRRAKESKAFGRVFAWTVTICDAASGEKLLEDTQVDGIIYGFLATHYYDDMESFLPLYAFLQWIKDNTRRRYYARVEDAPW